MSSSRWHLKAAEAGHGEAMFFVANSYQFEHGCSRDYKARPPASKPSALSVLHWFKTPPLAFPLPPPI